MNIAIQSNKPRDKEIISLLESFGGKNGECQKLRWKGDSSNPDLYYYIDKDGYIQLGPCPKDCKAYTLEKFETQFPFKIGDLCIYHSSCVGDTVVKILGLSLENDKIMYEIGHKDTTTAHSFIYRERYELTPYKEMKEERNITLTLDKAKEWYKKGGELKEIALQAFTEKELNPLPRSWEEFCKQGNPIASWRYTIPTKYETFFKLEQLRDCWRGNWKPNWQNSNERKYAIRICKDESSIEMPYITHAFLSFPTYELALEFQECFKDLIEKAGDLI